jgi:FtsZ-binding cell division protein ZapB
MQETITLMPGEIKELKDKIEAIQNSEATVFAPSTDVVIEADEEEKAGILVDQIAHVGSGA